MFPIYNNVLLLDKESAEALNKIAQNLDIEQARRRKEFLNEIINDINVDKVDNLLKIDLTSLIESRESD